MTQSRLPVGSEGRKQWLARETTPDAVIYANADHPSQSCIIHSRPPLSLAHYDGSDVTAYGGTLLSDTGPSAEQHRLVQIVAFDVPAHYADEVDRWYDEEHINLLMRAKGWLRARRYRVTQPCAGRPFTSIAIHELRDRSVMDAPERAAARATPWRAKFASLDWFEGCGRWLYQRVAP